MGTIRRQFREGQTTEALNGDDGAWCGEN